MTKFKQIRSEMGLKKTRAQQHSPETITNAVRAIRIVHTKAGIREMKSLLLHEHSMMVSRSVVAPLPHFGNTSLIEY